LNDDSWHLIAWTYDRNSQAQCYIDGVNVGHCLFGYDNPRGGQLPAIDEIAIGGNNGWFHPFNGVMDEFHYSSIKRSTNWLLTEYNNQNAPSTFWLIGTEQTAGVWSPYVTQFTIANGQVPSTQTSFPALISGSDARFKSIGNGGNVNSSSGYDLQPF